MLFFKSYGLKSVITGVDEYLVKCPSCESYSWADVMVMTDYYYFSFVPMFPTDKQAVVFCKKCGLKRYGMSLDEKLISNFEEVKLRRYFVWCLDRSFERTN